MLHLRVRLLRMVYSSVVDNIQLERKFEALEKQAKNAVVGYQSLMEEHEKKETQLATLSELVKNIPGEGEEKGEVLLKKLLTQNGDLKSEVQSLEKKMSDTMTQVNL